MATKGCDLRSACMAGALFQAVRDLARGLPDWRISELIRNNFKTMTKEQADEVVALAWKGLIAGGRMQRLREDESLPPGAIPRLPR